MSKAETKAKAIDHFTEAMRFAKKYLAEEVCPEEYGIHATDRGWTAFSINLDMETLVFEMHFARGALVNADARVRAVERRGFEHAIHEHMQSKGFDQVSAKYQKVRRATKAELKAAIPAGDTTPADSKSPMAIQAAADLYVQTKLDAYFEFLETYYEGVEEVSDFNDATDKFYGTGKHKSDDCPSKEIDDQFIEEHLDDYTDAEVLILFKSANERLRERDYIIAYSRIANA